MDIKKIKIMKHFTNQTQFRKYYDSKKIFSQNGQDYFVAEYFNFKKKGIFVDIGANDGIKFSNTYHLEKQLNWGGICIEPIPTVYEKLNINRTCTKINVGISDKDSIETFAYMEPSSMMLSGILKEYHPNHLDRINAQMKEKKCKLIKVEVKCTLINKLLENNKIYNIDYMNIDTEGNEFKIIKSLDFEKFKITILSVENNYKDKNQTSFILSKGYQLIGILGGDEIFIKK